MFDRQLRLETSRLILRPFKEEDSTELFEIMKDREMTLYTPDEEWKSIEDAYGFLKLAFWLYESEHQNFRHFLAITLKDDGEVIGICGVGGVEYDRSQNEVFYHVGKNNWGRGYASETAEALMAYAFEQLKLQKVIGIVHPDNTASNRVLEKIGMTKSGVVSGLEGEFSGFNGENLYCLERTDYLKK